MGLDFVIEDDTRVPPASLSLSAESHWELVKISKALKLELFARFHDFYENGQIEAHEIPEFLRELRRLEYATAGSSKLRLIICDLSEIAADAGRVDKPIRAWAD